MKRNVTFSMIFIASILLFSCKSKEKNEVENLNDTDEQIQITDENFLKNYAEAVFEDNLNSKGASQRIVTEDICGATVDRSLFITNKEIKINFDGKIRCSDGCSRNGVVILTLTQGKSWSDKNAEITLAYINYTISKPTAENPDSKLTFSGVKKIVNTLGGLVSELSSDRPIVHLVKFQDFLIKYNDQDYSTSTWNSSRKKTISKDNAGVISVKNEGVGSVQGRTSVADWGNDKNGNTFLSYFESPKIQRFCNNHLKDVSGIKIKEGGMKITYMFGVDQDGNQAEVCNAYGFKISWKGSDDKIKEKVIKY